MKAEGFCSFEFEEKKSEPEGWGRERVNKLYHRRLLEIKKEQKCTDYIFPSDAFNRLVLEIIRGFIIDVHFTVEASECIQTLTEEYLVGLAEDANLNAIQGRREVVTHHDLQLARQIRGERS